jgi:uncharacterized membrane protein
MKTPITLAAFLIAGAAQAVAAVPAASAAARKIPGVSDEGNAILAKAQATPDPQLQALAAKARAAHDQLMSAAMAPVIDVDKVAAALKAEDDAQAEIRDHAADRLVAALKSLSADDRGTFLRTLVLARQQRQGAPAKAPASTPQP